MASNKRSNVVIKPTMISIVVASLYGIVPSAFAGPLPTGGQFTAGSGSIEQAGTSLTINQNSARGVINWDSFSVANGNRVTFNNGSGATLNRVTGGNASSILGTVSATGSVYLINPQGIVVGRSGIISTGGRFVASTLDTDNTSFMNGGPLTLSGSSTSRVVNLGKIGSTNGDVFLVSAAEVDNLGDVSAPKGTAEAAAGRKVLLQDSSTGLQVFVQVGSHGTVWNQGNINAAQVGLQAADGNVFALSGNHTAIRATGTATRDGHVWLVADTGKVQMAGNVAAQNADGSGGTVDTSAGSLAFSGDGPTVTAGTWNVAAPTFTLGNAAAKAFAKSLNAHTSINVQTTGANGSNGDINVASNVGWNGAASLTLGAYHSVTINKGVTIKNQGAGNLTLRADATGIDNGASVINNGKLDWSKSMGAISALYDINGSYTPGTLLTNDAWSAPLYSGLQTQITGYQLLNSLDDVNSLNSDNLSIYAENYALGKDIDANGNTASIGCSDCLGTGPYAFTGQFDGRGHTISNASTVRGLFGLIGKGGVVRDVNLTNATGGSGILTSDNQGVIANVFVSGQVGNPVPGDQTGFGAAPAGGLVATNEGIIERAGSSATVYNDGPAGGLAGQNSGYIVQSYATGNVSSPGIEMIVEAGGLVGVNAGTIEQSYATGSVSGMSYDSGGLVAQNNGTITQSFATGNVSGYSPDPHIPTQLGGIAASGSGTIGPDVYWNKETTGQASGGPGATSGNGLTTAQMSDPASFSGWDFSASGDWAMPTGGTHPVLRWQNSQPSNGGGSAPL